MATAPGLQPLSAAKSIDREVADQTKPATQDTKPAEDQPLAPSFAKDTLIVEEVPLDELPGVESQLDGDRN